MAVIADIQNLDDWAYDVSIDSTRFGKADARLDYGTRTSQRVCIDGDLKAYRKWDMESRGVPKADGAADKVASDLAQVLGLAIPGVLLWQDSERFGCVQKEPPFQVQPISYAMKAMRVDDGPERTDILARIAKAYLPQIFYFDLWVYNRDRRLNLQNLLISESSTATLIWPIDYNCAFGHGVETFPDGHGFESIGAPLPEFLESMPLWVKTCLEDADNCIQAIMSLHDDIVTQICCRAFEFYGDILAKGRGENLASNLLLRRRYIKEWAAGLLPQAA